MNRSTSTSGETGKREGMALAAKHKSRAINECKVAFIDALLSSPNSTATIEDADINLNDKFVDGGKWRGSVTRHLALLSIIEPYGYEKSRRPSRHCGTVMRWRLRDRAKAERHRIELLEKKSDPSVGSDGSESQAPTEQGRLFDDI